MKSPLQFIYIDLFCGAGGVTTGIEEARINGKKVAKVIACVNHDELAIKSHARNHKHVLHFTEDIRTLDVTPIVRLVEFYRQKYPHAIVVLWASAECTNYSKAKGGQARDADSRTLPLHLYRYIEAINPDLVQIENVEEFMAWGPLDEKGRPVSRKNGRDFRKWVEHIEDYGYSYDHRILNAADFGAYTSRKRYFAQFAKPGVPVSWPKPTHSKTPSSGMFGSLKPWKAVRNVLDLKDEGKSIFGRKKPLVEASLARIFHGLKKHVAPGADAFITKYYSGQPEHKNISIDGPAATVKCKDGQALIKANFLTKYYGTGVTIPTDSVASTITTKDRMGLVTAAWLDKHYSGAHNHQSIDQPAGSVLTKDKYALVNACWLDKQFSGTANHQSINQPAGAILSNDKHCLMQAESWIMPTSYTNVGRSLDEPCPTLLASRKHHYLVNPQFHNKGNSVEVPAPTLIAGMGKRPLSLVTCSHVANPSEASHLAVTESGELAIVIYDSDSPYTRQIKELMAELGIVDIKMRMLKVPELKMIQGFPRKYYLAGNQSDQKKFIGNSVPPRIPRAMVEANAAALIQSMEEQLIAA